MPTPEHMNNHGIVGVLLAAGQGRRFGSDKLLHPLADGTPMAVAAARRLLAACPLSVAVLRPEQQALASLLSAEGLRVSFSDEADQGMGHSLSAAVRATPQASGWLIALADMPFIAPDTLLSVATRLDQGASIAAPFHQGRRGHPVGFAQAWFDALSALTGDQGARDILRAHEHALQRLDTTDAGVLIDIDTPDMLTAWPPAAASNP